MSSIRMTGYLRGQIMSKGHNLFAEAIEKADKELASDFGDRLMGEIYDTHYRPFIPKNFPTEWTQTIKGINLTLDGTVKGTGTISYNVTLSVNRVYNIPSVSNLVSYQNYLRQPNNFICSQLLFDEYYKFRSRVNKIRTEAKEFTTDLNRVLNRCNTLKQFLESWPQGESLIDPEIIKELNKPRPKRETPERIDSESRLKLSTTLIKRTILKR